MMQISINLNGKGKLLQGINPIKNENENTTTLVWTSYLLQYINPESFVEGQGLEEGIHYTQKELFSNVNFVDFIEQTKTYLKEFYPESLQAYLNKFKLDADAIGVK